MVQFLHLEPGLAPGWAFGLPFWMDITAKSTFERSFVYLENVVGVDMSQSVFMATTVRADINTLLQSEISYF